MVEFQGSPRRPRFSLLNLVLVLTMAAFAAAFFSQQQKHSAALQALEVEKKNAISETQRLDTEIQRLKWTNQRLRRRLGMIDVKDPAKVYAVRLHTDAEYADRWQVWLPEGRRWRVRVLDGHISATGFEGGSGMGTELEPGEHEIKLVVSVNPRYGKGFLRLHVDSHARIGMGGAEWFEWKTGTQSVGSAIDYEVQSFDPKLFELKRLRVYPAGAQIIPAEPSAGFLILIEPVEGDDE